MAEPEVTRIVQPVRLPDEVLLTRADLGHPRFTPRELDQIKDRYGRSFSGVVTDLDGDDKFVVCAWLKLRREGWQISLEEMADIVIEVVVQEDPSNADGSTSSPASAASGE